MQGFKTRQLQRGRLQQQQGFQLVAVLVVILLVLFTSKIFTNALFSFQQELSSNADKVKAQRAVEKALLEGEQLIDLTDAALVPRSSATLDTTESNSGRLVIWSKNLDNYELEMAVDPNTGSARHWWDQPSSWWEKNATLAVTTPDGIKAYYGVEHLGRGRAGEDLTDGVDYLDYPGSHYFRVTGRSLGSRNTSITIQSTYAKKFF